MFTQVDRTYVPIHFRIIQTLEESRTRQKSKRRVKVRGLISIPKESREILAMTAEKTLN